MDLLPAKFETNRTGFYYYPDTLHYTNGDLNTWLPRLMEMGTGWLTLRASPLRAIPETFISGLIEAGIQPVLHFDFTPAAMPDLDSLSLLFLSYKTWGVRYVVLFDRPNLRKNWPPSGWGQSDLVERFLDLYLPVAQTALEAGLTNVFPPLEPGGDYWDTAFLRAALQSMQRRGQQDLLDTLVIGAYGWCDERPLQWGAGGPERWPGARPYVTPAEQEDQRGLYIFDWYSAITKAVLKSQRSILLLGAGSRINAAPDGKFSEVEETNHAHRNLAIARRLAAPAAEDPEIEAGDHLPPIPSDVLGVCFWLLAAASDSPQAAQAWYQPDGSTLAAADALRRWVKSHLEPEVFLPETPIQPGEEAQAGPVAEAQPPFSEPTLEEPIQPKSAAPEVIRQPAADFPIEHYLLLPLYEWGAAEWHLDAARPFILRHKATVGFSKTEAAFARQVTVVGGEHTYSEQVLADLRSAGCVVRRISGDGTEIASQLANL